MSPDDFRRHGRAVVDWIAAYMESVGTHPVLSRSAPTEIRARLPPHPPATGEPFEAMLRDIDDIILPGVTHWQSPNFFAYFPANASGPAILGELLSAGLGVQGMLWATSPACTELETHMLDWLVELLGLPEGFSSRGPGGGVIQDSASSATLCALIAARERVTSGATNRTGIDRRLTVYSSSEAHSSVEKAVRIAGLGSDNLRAVPIDANGAMKAGALRALVTKDVADGATPCLVVATAGTTSSLAFDPVAEIAEVCAAEGMWLHVDAAMAGTAALCPELRFVNDGLEGADSYCFNPHKWMLVNFDCDCFYVTDRAALINALSVLPEYLRNEASESGDVIDYRDWQVPLGRRFRALKLWFVVRHYGVEGLRTFVRRHVELTRTLVEWIQADPDFEIASPTPLNLVCFRHRSGDEVTHEIMRRVNASGSMYITHTRVNGLVTLRLCVGQTHTESEHVERAWSTLRHTAAHIAGERR